LTVPNKHAPALWDKLLKAHVDFEVLPIGLGARDSLRLEAGFLLSGQDFSGDRTTIETNCAWVIKWDHEFNGKEILQKMKEEKTHEKMIGIVLEGRAPARAGSVVKLASSPHETVGSVSSGNYAPSLGKGIAMAYLKREYAKPGIDVILEYHGRELKGVTTKTPFINKV
jgi:aminomethyltransferase